MTYLTLAEWGGTPNGWPQMALPVPNLDVHHSVTNEEIGVPGTADAIADFRELDAIGLSRGHGGISYSYAIHTPTGIIGEGQGTRRGAHTAGDGCNHSPWGWNPCTIGVVFIGDFQPSEVDGVVSPGDTLTPEAVAAFRFLREKLITDGVLAPGTYPTGGHRDMLGNATSCPGDNIEDHLDLLRASSELITEDSMYYLTCADTQELLVVSELRVAGYPLATAPAGLVAQAIPVDAVARKAEIDARNALVVALSPKADGGAVPDPAVKLGLTTASDGLAAAAAALG